MSLLAKRVKFQGMLSSVRRSLKQVPEHRTDRNTHNTRYEIVDAGLGALSVFYMQSPGFLASTAHRRATWSEQCQGLVWAGDDPR